MAFKDIWKDKVDGQDYVLAEDINEIARAVIENEEAVKKNAEDVQNKAPKSTTLEGYGITDAYNKKQADEKFQEKLSEQQLKNISDVTNKQNQLSDEQIKNINDVQNKVAKEQGKGLSTNDYTTEEKQAVAKIFDKADVSYVKNTFANALKGTASGESVVLDDVSPIEHTMAVKVKSKNVVSIADKTIRGDKGYTSGSISVALSPNTVYTLSVDFAQTGSKATVGITVRDNSGATIERSDTTTDTNGRLSATFTVPTDGKIAIALFSNITATAITGTYCVYSNFQIEEGTTATAYAPYVEDVSAVSVKKYGKNVAYEATYGDLEVGDTSKSVIGFKSPTLKKGKTYTLSFDTENTGALLTFVTYNRPVAVIGSSNVTADGTRQSVTFTMTDDFYKNYSVTWVQLRSASTANSGLCSDVQLETNSVATEYEPYKEPTTHIPNADGTVEGALSVYPTTTLISDKEGAIIDCEYNRDLNKAFEELTNAIISLGGNV